MNRTYELLFNKSTFLLVPTFLFLWYSADSFYSYKISEAQLIPHKGKIVFLDTISAKTKKDIHRYGKGSASIIRIDKEPAITFYLNIYPNSRRTEYLLSNIKMGEIVAVYTQPLLFDGTFVREKSTIIAKLSTGSKVIVPFDSTISDQVNLNFMVFSLVGFFLFFGLYVFKIFSIWKKNIC